MRVTVGPPPKTQVDGEPAWLGLARGLGRKPHVLLLEHTCWKCGASGYAVALATHLTEKDLERAHGLRGKPAWWDDAQHGVWDPAETSLLQEVSLTMEGGFVCSLESGGSLGHPTVQKPLQAFLAKYSGLRDQVATFKGRHSLTMAESYLSQGCPACDALWGNFPLQELVSQDYGQAIVTRNYEHPGLIFIFNLELDSTP